MLKVKLPDAAGEDPLQEALRIRLLLNPREAAFALSISERTLFELTVPQGTLPCIRLSGSNGQRRYHIASLVKWIELQEADQSASKASSTGDESCAAPESTLPNPLSKGLLHHGKRQPS